jgi:penicillin amidase
VDRDYPFYLSSDLENPARASRIAALLADARGLTMDDFARFQLDTYSAGSARFVDHLRAIEPADRRQHRAIEYLRAWDGRLEPGSVAAAIVQVCQRRAIRLVFDPHLGDLADAYAGVGLTRLGENSPYADRCIVRLLDLLDGRGSDAWLRDPDTGQMRQPGALLRQALDETLDLLAETLGGDMARWTWGRLNQVRLGHVLGVVRPLDLLLNRGPYPMGGGWDTLLRASGKPGFPAGVEVSDAVRFIADPGDWDACRIVMPGGQSGHVASRHYADLIPLWLEGRFQTMPFSREAVESHAASRAVLEPR